MNGFDVGGKTYFDMIFRPEDGTPWVTQVGLEGAAYQAAFEKWTGQGYRLLHAEVV